MTLATRRAHGVVSAAAPRRFFVPDAGTAKVIAHACAAFFLLGPTR